MLVRLAHRLPRAPLVLPAQLPAQPFRRVGPKDQAQVEVVAGRSDTAVSAELGTTRAAVEKWLKRLPGKGLEGLLNAARPGAPRQIGRR